MFSIYTYINLYTNTYVYIFQFDIRMNMSKDTNLNNITCSVSGRAIP